MSRVLRALLLTCVILGLVLGFLFYRQVPRSQRPFKGADKADAFDITEGTQSVRLVLSGSWTVQMQGSTAPADLAKANRVAAAVAAVQVEDQISDRADRAAEFQVDASSGVHVKALKNQKLVGEGIFGKQAPDYQHIYFAFPNKPAVFMARGMFRADLEPVTTNAWRSREMTQIVEAEIQSLSVSSNNQTVSLAHSSDTWTVNGKTVDPAKVYALLGVVSHLRADGFTDFTQSASASSAALAINTAHGAVMLHIDAVDPIRKQAAVFIDGTRGGFWLNEDKIKQLLFKPSHSRPKSRNQFGATTGFKSAESVRYHYSVERIVFLDRETIPAALPALSFLHEWVEYPSTAAEQTAERVKDATIAITNKVKITREAIASANALKFVAVSATGFDCVDIAACRERKILVSNIPAYAGPSTAEHTMLLMLALRRNLSAYLSAVREGAWNRSSQFTLQDFPSPGLEGAILGLIGYGDIGQRVETLARAFGMEVLIGERRGAPAIRPGRVSFEEAFRKSDVVSLHCPSTPETRGLINKETLSWMKPTAVLINAARGTLVDEAALADALSSGRLGGAGIDVLGEEPPRNGSPLLSLKLPNLIVTPHMAWNGQGSIQRMTGQLIRNIDAFIQGRPVNVVC